MEALNKIFDKIYVITIPSFTDRIENMKKRLDGIDYEFFYGVYGGDLDTSEYRDRGSKLTRGQLSCALSHYKIYEKMVQENLDNVLILEDDCAFNSSVIEIEKYYNQLPENYSVFYLGNQKGKYLGNGCSENLKKVSVTLSLRESKASTKTGSVVTRTSSKTSRNKDEKQKTCSKKSRNRN